MLTDEEHILMKYQLVTKIALENQEARGLVSLIGHLDYALFFSRYAITSNLDLQPP